MAATKDPVAAPDRSTSRGSDSGSRDQDSSPRIAWVAKDEVSWAGGVMTGLTANHAPIGRYHHHRRVHSGTSSNGALSSLDHALNGCACRRKTRA